MSPRKKPDPDALPPIDPREFRRNIDDLAEDLDDLRLWNALAPAVKAAIQHGGGNADHILQKSQALAAVELVKLLRSEKDDVRLRASSEILNRSLGKPIERRIDFYAEIKNMQEQEIDTRIKTLVNQIGGGEVIDAIIASSPRLAEKEAMKRKKTLAAPGESDDGSEKS